MFQKGLEMFRFPVVKSSLRFPNVKIVAVPATSFVNDNCDRLSRPRWIATPLPVSNLNPHRMQEKHIRVPNPIFLIFSVNTADNQNSK